MFTDDEIDAADAVTAEVMRDHNSYEARRTLDSHYNDPTDTQIEAAAVEAAAAEAEAEAAVPE